MNPQCEHDVYMFQTCIPCGRSAGAMLNLTDVQSTMHEAVNRPAHYNQGEVECIDAMRAAFGDEAVSQHCLCNAFKYLWRADHKGKKRQDLEKAVWYIRFALGDDPRLDPPKSTPR